ncbi:MAG TPA: Tat pathway signal protein, partial [Thermoanaerobaculia bacterium]
MRARPALSSGLVLFLTVACARPLAPPSGIQPVAVAPAETALSASDVAFLDDLEHRTFRWFWDKTNPKNGLVPDREPTASFSSVAA